MEKMGRRWEWLGKEPLRAGEEEELWRDYPRDELPIRQVSPHVSKQ